MDTIIRTARRAEIPVARFLPVLIPCLFHYSNLRNHRKILVVDGRVGFTGGINIREGHCLQRKPRHAERDIHFRIVGPVVAHLQQSFAQDWFCTTGEEIVGDAWFPEITSAGNSLARGIADGPDEDLDKLRMVLLGAIASAPSSITIVTPFFLPDAALSVSMQTDAWHHRSDSLTSIAAFIGISIALIAGKGYEAADDWAAFFAAAVIAFNGTRLFRSAWREVLDVSPPPEVITNVRSVAQSVGGVVEIEKCRIRKSGLELFVEIHVVVNGDMTVREGHALSHQVKDRIIEEVTGIQDVLAHIEPSEA